MAEEKPAAENIALAARLNNAGLYLLFALVLLIPKTLALRHRRWRWNALRLLAGVVGALLLRAGVEGGAGRWAPLVGLLLLVLALLIRPAPTGPSLDAHKRRLGALVVVNGGLYAPAGEKPLPVRLFVAPERMRVVDEFLRTRLEIPFAEVRALHVLSASPPAAPAPTTLAAEDWVLLVEWAGGAARFSYQGHFAEHLARVAETTLRHQLRRELPVML